MVFSVCWCQEILLPLICCSLAEVEARHGLGTPGTTVSCPRKPTDGALAVRSLRTEFNMCFGRGGCAGRGSRVSHQAECGLGQLVCDRNH
ncbi:hypothetical protein C8F04DRAFT_463362 [Mycena alexandri]|uniref:Secreted protein n=1 Tax=Mycena alexandri TaxID=1745969 RepID=A0AAD6X2M5_9AGAR|nr:hypothetical protein C8F04DRAFT_463362 [Mycena alexandri]